MHHGTLPLGWVAVVLQECWPLFLMFIAILLWIFPDGRLPSGRWHRWSVVLVIVGLLIGLAASSQGLLAVTAHHLRVKASGDLASSSPGVLNVLARVVIVATLVSWVTWLVFQIHLPSRPGGERRQQLKWLYSGAAIFVVWLIIGVFIVPVSMGEAPGWAPSRWSARCRPSERAPCPSAWGWRC